MKKILSLMKRGAKWYFKQASCNYAWLPSGTIPYVG